MPQSLTTHFDSIGFIPSFPSFILSKRTHTVCRRRGKCVCGCDTNRPFPVSNLSAGNRTVLSWRLRTPPPRICFYRGTSDGPASTPGRHREDS
jgi:hypothetical protein